MTREEMLKHPDYVYCPFEQDLHVVDGEVERAMKRFIESAGEYADKKYGLPLSAMMIQKSAKITFQIFDQSFNWETPLMLRAELSNQEWFDKEVLGE